MRLLISSVFLLFSISLIGQSTTFQRIYPATDRSMFNVSSSDINSGSYYNMNFFVDAANESGINITKFFPKGDVEWSFDYSIEDLEMDELSLFTGTNLYGDIETTEDGGAVIAYLNFDPNGVVTRKNVFKIDGTGSIVWSQHYGDEDFVAIIDEIKIADNGSGGQLMAGPGARNIVEQELYLSNIDADGNIVWDKGVYAVNDDNTVKITRLVDLNATPAEPGSVVTANLDQDLPISNLMLNKLDQNGDSQWSMGYRPADLGDFDIVSYATGAGEDSTYVNVGEIQTDLGQGAIRVPYVFKVNKDGSIAWSKIITTPDLNVLFFVPTQVEYLVDGNLVVVARYLGADGNNGEFSIVLSPEGDVISYNTYDRVRGVVFLFDNTGNILNRFYEGGLSATDDGGFMYSSTGFTGTAFNHYLLKSNLTGSAFCSDTLTLDTLPDFPFVMDTVTLSERTVGLVDTIELSAMQFGDYDVPVPNLLDTVYCPQDPINLTLDATQPNAISYEWETGETTPMLNVTSEGSYRVIVTFDTDVCYTLCDTATIERFDMPTAVINANDSRLCEEGLIGLNASAQGPGPYTFMWESGEISQGILVDQTGEYKVTITDGCMNTAEASYTLNDVDFIVPFDFGIQKADILTCIDGEGFIELSILVFEGMPETFTWSTTEIGDTISVSGPGTYSVTGVSNCGTIVTKEITLNEEDFDQDTDVEVFLDASDLVCMDGTGFITLSIDSVFGGDIYNVMWSTGSTDNSTEVTLEGTYSVTVTDVCGIEVVSEITLVPEDFNSQFSVQFDLIHQYICQDNSINIFTEPFTLANVSNYKWSTGEGGPDLNGINVTEPDLYTLTVTDDCGATTVGTINITQDNFQLEFALQYGLICEPRGFDITLEFWTANIANYDWSTGESGEDVDRIFVTDGGEYKLTLTDECGNETEESINIPDGALPVDLVPSISFDCNEDDCNTIILCGSVEDNEETQTWQWTFGNTVIDNDECIFLTQNEIGQVNFTVTNECDPFVANYDLTATDFECFEPVELVPSVFFDCLPDDDNMIRICATNDQGVTADAYTWTSPSGVVSNEECLDLVFNQSELGDYNLVIEYNCTEYMLEEAFELNDNRFLCGQKPCLEFPNIFFPNSNTFFLEDSLQLNKSFGPLVKCDSMTITDFSIIIFNQWGKKVFDAGESVFSDFTLEKNWNGTHNGAPLEGGVYMYHSTWKNFDGEDEVSKGHVTMVK